MYRSALRTATRPGVLRTASRNASRRTISTQVSADGRRSWKSSGLRWALAVGAVYYYNTSPVFADEATPRNTLPPSAFDDEDLPTVLSILEEKREQIKNRLEPKPSGTEDSKPPESHDESKSSQTQPTTAAPEGSPGALEEEADQQGAFNPETGEINWDCPCLGGMAHGPCGEQFKTAFSCFVYSNEEPKGMDCIEKFQGMQECFREYPDVYGAELADEEDAEASEDSLPAAETNASRPAPTSIPENDRDSTGQGLKDEPQQEAASSGPPPTVDNNAAKPAPRRVSGDDLDSTAQKLKHDHERDAASSNSHTNAESHSSAPAASSERDPIPTKWDDARAANDEVEQPSESNPAKREKKSETKDDTK